MSVLAIAAGVETTGLVALLKGLGWAPATREVRARKWSDVQPVVIVPRRAREPRELPQRAAPAVPAERMEEDCERWDGLS